MSGAVLRQTHLVCARQVIVHDVELTSCVVNSTNMSSSVVTLSALIISHTQLMTGSGSARQNVFFYDGSNAGGKRERMGLRDA